jgi:hypothetical protein
MIDEQKIEENYSKFMEYVKADSRSEQLTVMYEDYGNELLTAPAAGKAHYHNAFPGGYLDHVLRVIDTTLQLSSLYKKMGGTINFTKEEAVFSALHHDLGKLGNPGTAPYYLDQDSDWHRKRGELYKHNPNLPYMQVPDRALMILQKYGIKLTDTEWLSIKLSDGLYDESTKSYLKTFTPYPLETSLPRIIHMADYMSSQVENDFTRF